MDKTISLFSLPLIESEKCMNLNNRLFVLAYALKEKGYIEQADAIAQSLEVTDVRQVGVITPGHPLYDKIRSLLHPTNSAVETKLSNFNDRLQV